MLKGLGNLDRKRLGTLIRQAKGTVTVSEAAMILDVTSTDAAKMLSRLTNHGWLHRIKRGIYIPVPLEASSADTVSADPWQIATKVYAPCYIGGWSAAEHWDLTEQIFRTTLVITQRALRHRHVTMNGTPFALHTLHEKKMFGLKTIWRDQIKVLVSDPTRTILDILADPQLGGGIRSVKDMMENYLSSQMKNLSLLIEYADQLENGAVFKRLGFLLEQLAPNDTAIIEQCTQRLSKGNARIDAKQAAERLVSRWRLWVPEIWLKGIT